MPGQDPLHDMPLLDAGEALIKTLMEICRSLVIQAHQMHNRGVQTGDVAAVFKCLYDVGR